MWKDAGAMEIDRKSLEHSLQGSLQWFEQSGVMRPPDGSWGVAERIVMKVGYPDLPKVMSVFPPWTVLEDRVVFEQRRADCCIQTAFLYMLSATYFQDSAMLAVAGNILDFMFCRSGLLLVSSEPSGLPPGIWNWCHATFRRFYFDDNSWVCVLMLMMAEHSPELEADYQLVHWAQKIAYAMSLEFPSYLSGEKSENSIPGTMKWRGNARKPHWGSLVCMALSRACEHEDHPEYRQIVDDYHDFLLSHEDDFNTSEWGYAVIGAAFAHHAFLDDKSERVMRHFGHRLIGSMDRNGNVPAQHGEAPLGSQLADLIYTLNWAVLALGCLNTLDAVAYGPCFDRLTALLLTLQEQSPEPHLFGCWRGMFDLEHGCWGGGNCSEGGAASIYTGWTNAPIAWSMVGRLLGSSIENLGMCNRRES